MKRVVLFDIDQTLIRSNGAGSGAMTETLKLLFDIDDGFAGVDFVGRTDRSILRQALAAHDRLDHDFENFVFRFAAEYLPRLEQKLHERGGVVLPGVTEILAAVLALPDTRMGLATGNFRRAAEIKLRHFALWEHFVEGGFADDGERREDLVAAAINRLHDGSNTPHRVIVIGDSIHDITAARANDAIAIGVTTGTAGADILLEAGAHAVFADLSDTAAVLRSIVRD